ncbi:MULTISPECIES: D-amino acid dehydrogenase [Chromobacterium]|uniref:D-amino acid dehydrogenase n=1 Tax=Chromobacterium TaxID=535 RepID=UPI001886EEEE|nr:MULTISPECIES: D-amino acid dehydrogenase [Chromobacterium]QOZ84079.1 FAD-dependent oxidoreductase [Chromobacterium sp. Rain0013]WON84230.1 D-amino acid dehydrogenase [Chromobacterium haemolyticum]
MGGSRVFVVGAGVIGLCSAWRLARAGWPVTVLERRGEAAAGASHANGGQLSYSYVAPLADAGVPAKALAWLLSADAPMRLRLSWDAAQWLWLWRFYRACNRKANRAGSAQLWRLAQESRVLLEGLREEGLGGFAWRRNGKLVLYRSAAALEHARQGVAAMSELGACQQLLDTDACHDLEPALAGLSGPIAGGVHTPDEEVADCRLFCLAMQRRMLEEGLDVEFRFGREVSGFEMAQGRVRQVLLSDEVLPCRHLVLAAGVGGAALARKLGLRLPLYPLKGYSLDMPAGECLPVLSVTDFERKTLYAPIDGRLRVAAAADLVGYDESPDPRRVAGLRRQVKRDWPRAGCLEQATEWAGLRPATPDGVPMIGRAPGGPANLWLNLGHGALGFTLALGSAERLAREMAGG